MNLFEIKHGRVSFSPQALSLKPFKDLWDRDKSITRAKPVAELSFVYYFADYRSDFADIIDEQERTKTIKEVLVGIKEGWRPDEKVKKAIEFYRKMQETPATLLLEDAMNAVDSIRKFFRNLDMTEEVDGKPKHDVKKVIESISQLSKVTEAIESLKSQVRKQLESKYDGMRGNKERSIFEDGI